MDRHTHHKALLAPLRAAQYDFSEREYRAALEAVCAPDAVFQMAHPLGEITGTDAFFEQAIAPLVQAWPDVERRDYIVMAGKDDDGGDWVGCGGFFIGVSLGPWLDIPATGHIIHMRFHEFYRFVDGKVVEMQSLWDIPEVMMQAKAWPMAPSLGREWAVPGPASQDGLVPGPHDAQASERTLHTRTYLSLYMFDVLLTLYVQHHTATYMRFWSCSRRSRARVATASGLPRRLSSCTWASAPPGPSAATIAAAPMSLIRLDASDRWWRRCSAAQGISAPRDYLARSS